MTLEKIATIMAHISISFVCIFIFTCAKYVTCFQYTVDFEGLDCGKQFRVSEYDVFTVTAKPNPISIGNPDHCKVKFVTDGTFKIFVDTLKISDCAVKLNFYDSDPTEKYEKYSLSCQGSSEPVLTTNTGELIIRLDKPSGDTKGYEFQLKITAGSEPSTGVGDTGGSGTGVQIGIGVGVAAFLIIIISIVCFFVCRQMRKEKQKPTQMQSSVFATVSSGDPEYVSEPRSHYQASSRRQQEEERRKMEEQRVPKLPEPKVNGILKGSPSRRRKRRGESGYDNEGYSASVSSTDESADFDFESYKKSIEEGGPGAGGRVKNFSSFPDPVKERRDRRERRKNYDSYDSRSNSHTSDSSADEYGHTNMAFTDETGQSRRSRSLGKSSGRSAASESTRRSYEDEDDNSTVFTRSTRTGSFRSRSHSDSRTEGSSDTNNYESRYERNPNNASIRRSRSRSQSRSSGKSRDSRRRHHHHRDHQSDGSSQGSHSQSHSHSHRHRSRSRDKKKASPYLPVFDDAKKIQKKMQKK